MEDAIPLDSKGMADICRRLNKSIGAMNYWQSVASAFKVPREVYMSFNPQPSERPTELLLKWLDANKPELTVGQLFTALQHIGRNDVISYLEKKFSSWSSFIWVTWVSWMINDSLTVHCNDWLIVLLSGNLHVAMSAAQPTLYIYMDKNTVNRHKNFETW